MYFNSKSPSIRILPVISAFVSLFLAAAAVADDANTVNVYSAREENLIKPLLDKFQQETKIQTNLITGKADALLVRIKSEGKESPADLLITTDAGRLYRAKSSGLLHCATTELIKSNIDARYRDADDCWTALSLRARVIMVPQTANLKSPPETYESLALPKWRGKLCIRSSSNIYNQSLVASMITANGEKAAAQWLAGLTANFARSPVGGDRDQITAAANGLCDIAIANTYYLAMMLESSVPAHRTAAESIKVIWPNQSGRGAHVNVSGAGVVRTAPHKENALKLLEYLTGKSAQLWLAEHNHEYPLRQDVAIPERLQNFGSFKADSVALEKLGELNTPAVKLMDQAGWK